MRHDQKAMTGATLFSGIHAPECAAPEIAWKFCAEIEAFPSSVGKARHPRIPNLGDVTAPDFIDRARKVLDGSTLDVLVFGSPCQGFSVAGKRLGLDDPRSNLALHALRIVRDLAPAWFTFENVPGLFSCWSGAPERPTGMELGFADGGTFVREFIESSDFAEFLQRVSDIGYFGAWKVLDAQYDGVAQRRKRVFFVGNSRDWRYSAAVLLEPESLCGHPPAREEARERLAGGLEVGVGIGSGAGLLDRQTDRQTDRQWEPSMQEREAAADWERTSRLMEGWSVVPALTQSGRGVERTGESRGQDPVIPVFR